MYVFNLESQLGLNPPQKHYVSAEAAEIALTSPAPPLHTEDIRRTVSPRLTSVKRCVSKHSLPTLGTYILTHLRKRQRGTYANTAALGPATCTNSTSSPGRHRVCTRIYLHSIHKGPLLTGLSCRYPTPRHSPVHLSDSSDESRITTTD